LRQVESDRLNQTRLTEAWPRYYLQAARDQGTKYEVCRVPCCPDPRVSRTAFGASFEGVEARTTDLTFHLARRRRARSPTAHRASEERSLRARGLMTRSRSGRKVRFPLRGSALDVCRLYPRSARPARRLIRSNTNVARTKSAAQLQMAEKHHGGRGQAGEPAGRRCPRPYATSRRRFTFVAAHPPSGRNCSAKFRAPAGA